MKILEKNSSGLSGNNIMPERTKTKKETNQGCKRCRLAIMSTVWIAILIPSNVIAAIFFFKTQNSDFLEIKDSTVLSLDNHNELDHVTVEDRKKASSNEKDEEKTIFLKIPVCNGLWYERIMAINYILIATSFISNRKV